MSPAVTIRQAAEYLSVSQSSVRRLIRSGELPSSMPVRKHVIRIADLDRLLARSRFQSREYQATVAVTDSIQRDLAYARSVAR